MKPSSPPVSQQMQELNSNWTATLNIQGTGEITIYIPMGQSPPVITGDGDYTIVYYELEIEADDQNES